MRLISWNVNGIRAAWEQGVGPFLAAEQPDVVGFQEVKSQFSALPEEIASPRDYQVLWHGGGRPGYSGVAIFLHRRHSFKDCWWVKGLGVPEFDREGRVLTLELREFFFVTAYFPNSGPGGRRLEYKVAFCKAIEKFCDNLRGRGKDVILCGDLNVAHLDIDVHDVAGARGSAGFLALERAWMDALLQRDEWVDAFRFHQPQDPHHYTWWSFFDEDRAHNRGWRIDGFLTSPGLAARGKVRHHHQVMGSDHCPIELDLRQVE